MEITVMMLSNKKAALVKRKRAKEYSVIKPTVWINPGVVTIYGSSIDANAHMHHAIQVIWPFSDSLCKLNGRKITGVTVIDSKVDHQLEMVEGWVLLIEPKSNLGRELVTKLMGQPFKSFRTTFQSQVINRLKQTILLNF